MNTVAYCLERCGGPGAVLDHATAFLPPRRQAAVLALFALQNELLRAVAEPVGDELTPARLAWWQDELERLTDAPTHPVTRTLADCGVARLLPEDLPRAMIDAHAVEHTRRRFVDREALVASCHALNRPLAQALAIVCEHDAAASRACALLVTVDLVNRLADVGRDIARDRLNIPLDELGHAGISVARVLDGSAVRDIVPVLASLSACIKRRQHDAFAKLDARDRRALRPLLVHCSLSLCRLAEIERDGFRVFGHDIQLTPVRMAWLAWRTRRFPRWSPAAGYSDGA